jgi:flagellar basal-body rod protein FlgB
MIEGLFNREVYQMAQVLMDRSMLRHEAIASNIANVETPGYKRIDLDRSFETELQARMQEGDTEGMRALPKRLAVDPLAVTSRPDGNNVQIESEMLAMNRNALEYEFLSKYMSKSFGRIKSAISGSVNNL